MTKILTTLGLNVSLPYWALPSLLPDLRAPDLMGAAISPQPWARHARKPTSLEVALNRWDEENPIPSNRYGFPAWVLDDLADDDAP